MNNSIRKNAITIEGWLSIFINLVLFALKLWAGVACGSLALIADAWHTLSDSISSVIVLIGGKLSRKPADKKHPFGHGRAEHITAIIIGVILAIVAFDFAIGAIEKFQKHEYTHYGTAAIVVTIISILMKEGLAQYALRMGRKINSTILRADGWHHRTDALSSVIILVGIVTAGKFWWTDAVLSLAVAIMIGWTSYEILSKDIRSLLGESPSPEILKAIKETGEGVCNKKIYLHNIHVHNYGQYTEVSLHIKLNPRMPLHEAHEICSKIETALKNKFGYIATIHPEPLTNE